ncbi:alpha-L-rhamnosidase [Agrobacterium tumefaciens]|nr:alpha-L-rhamnosidase [Agrobacterium tumefaciens]KAJ32717.1 alpha-L-rhamnosidase [Agrobacterium tumefaciens]
MDGHPAAGYGKKLKTTSRTAARHEDDDLRASDGIHALAGCRMISPRLEHDRSAGAPCFHKEFYVAEKVASAVLSITAFGLVHVELNGSAAIDDVLAPGWTDYRYRLMYSAYDVSDLIRVGDNRLEIMVGNGWYRGQLGRPSRRDLYGERLGLLACLTIVFVNGETLTIKTDENWNARSSHVAQDDLYDGCLMDFRSTPRQLGVEALKFDSSILEKQAFPGIGVTERIIGVSCTPGKDSPTVYDFGQNVVGWVRLKIKPQHCERTVTVRHAEVLEDGKLSLRPLRAAKATDIYHLPASGPTELEPRFTFHGFRYASIDGVDQADIECVEAIVVGSKMRRTGWFSCSDLLLNKLHENVVWSMRGNFLGVPTDCPQRDERLGWTADIQVFAPTATFLYDCTELLESWLRELSAAQLPDGSVPVVIPDVYRRPSVATAGWGDAATVVPWVVYQHTGHAEVLERHFETMRKWLARIEKATGPDLIWRGGHQYGDWLDPTAPPDDPASAMTDRDLVATACFYRSAKIAADTASVLGLAEDAQKYSDLRDAIFDRFQTEFVTRAGRLTSETQAAYAIVLTYGLLLPNQVRKAGERLADLVRKAAFTIGTGFLGTPVILDALCMTGHERVAMRLIDQTECPSWLYPVKMGATTMWERWDSLLPTGEVNPGEMTSFNHYAFGAVADWVHRAIAGLRSEQIGWKAFSVTPPLWTGLTFAEATIESPAGTISSRWDYFDGVLKVKVRVPEGVSAYLHLPGETIELPPGLYAIERAVQAEGAKHRQHSVLTTRHAIDSFEIWSVVETAIREYRPDWNPVQIARAAFPYLDLPLPDLSRCVGLSIPTVEEDALRATLTALSAELTTKGFVQSDIGEA